MSAPRTKRQFAGASSDPAQRQIKDFFKPASSGTNSTTSTSTPTDLTSGPLSPPLPGAVQANLLSVGMRVRKSVPEGYKTGEKYSAFSLWADNTTPGQGPAQQQQSSSPSRDFQLPSFPPQAANPSFTGRRELLPFCGINKVGGLAVQPDAEPIPVSFFTPSALDDDDVSSSSRSRSKPTISLTPAAVPEIDDLPSLTSSQNSVLSTSSSSPPHHSSYSSSSSLLRPGGNGKKRFYTEDTTTASVVPGSAEGGDGSIIWRNRRDWLDGEVSPRSLAPVGWERNARVMAVPRGVMRKASSAATGAAGQDGQENRVAGFAPAVADDFEEAGFLADYMEVEEE